MSEGIVHCRVIECEAATATPGIGPKWAALKSRSARSLARWRLSRSIAHLDNRLLSDVGFSSQDLGSSQRLIRCFVAGGDFWIVGKTGQHE